MILKELLQMELLVKSKQLLKLGNKINYLKREAMEQQTQ